ncbi:MAG: hypothetical protein ABL994_19060 [Verrucomicrobiales bacterium]
MLTSHNSLTKSASSATQVAADLKRDLEFVSANQQIEGFSGEITEAIVSHQPDMKAIAESAKKFGAQVPNAANLSQPPLVGR